MSRPRLVNKTGKGKFNMQDVVPGLLSDIETAFNTRNMTDRTLARVSAKIRDGTATQIDGHTYAEHIGRNASKALQEVITPDRLPDGKLYYNIATRTVVPTLQNNQTLVNEAATLIQESIDKKTGIGLKSVNPQFPVERINGLIDKMTADDIVVEEALKWLGEPIINNTEAFMDDFIKDNAEFRSDAGLKTTITRVAETNCCQWCADLEGTFDYGDAPDEIYRRHEFCRCAVTVQYKKTSQNVWTKKEWESTPEEIERRIDTKPSEMTQAERQQTLARLERDRLVKQIIDATGYDRETANRIAGQSPEKIQKAIAQGRKYAYLRR